MSLGNQTQTKVVIIFIIGEEHLNLYRHEFLIMEVDSLTKIGEVESQREFSSLSGK